MSVTKSICLMISLVAVIALKLKHVKFALKMTVHIILVWIMNFLVLGQII